MKSRLFSFLMIMVHILSVNCRPLPPNTSIPLHEGATPVKSPRLDQLTMDLEQGEIGSNPPRCENKCYGCSPCEATQVPTIGVAIQDSNYEPEGWKCKCGRAFYSP